MSCIFFFEKVQCRGFVAESRKKKWPKLFRIGLSGSGGTHFSLLSTLHYVLEMPLDKIPRN